MERKIEGYKREANTGIMIKRWEKRVRGGLDRWGKEDTQAHI